VVYWTASLDHPDDVDGAVHPQHTATPSHYEPQQRWLHEFFVSLARTQRTVRAQVHTHRMRAFHSHTDDRYPIVHTPGFLSLVVPNFARIGLRISGLYLARINQDGQWCEAAIPDSICGFDA